MNFLRRGSGSSPVDTEEPEDAPEAVAVAGRTAPKGRPTPSRRSQGTRTRGPVAPPPKTQREALKRAKQLRGSRTDRREAAADRRKRMMAGDDRVLPVRERGAVRAYVRDLVDARRNLMGLFMPMAVLIFVTILIPSPQVQSAGTMVCLVLLAAMAAEGLLLARYVTGRVRAKFPNEEVKSVSVGWYAFTRATQIRKFRVPGPRVKRGETVG